MIELLLIAAAALGARGPAWTEWQRRRAQRRDFPAARVVYLPSGCCR